MIISKEYGPQFDRTDGTIGELQLVRRYVVVHGEPGQIWGASQGRCTYANERLAAAHVELVKRNNLLDRFPADLRVAPWWCYPKHHDPVGACEV